MPSSRLNLTSFLNIDWGFVVYRPFPQLIHHFSQTSHRTSLTHHSAIHNLVQQLAASMKRNFKVAPATIASYVVAFLATDYSWYRQEFGYVNSLVWTRVLGSRGDSAADQLGERQ